MSREEIKEKFLKSYNCSSMKEFKHTKLTSDKFYEIMEDYFTKCSYNQKYKELIDRLTFIKSRARAGATQETINKLAVNFINAYLKEVE